MIHDLALGGSGHFLLQTAPFICIDNGPVSNSSLVSSPGDRKGRLGGLRGKNLSCFSAKSYQDSFQDQEGAHVTQTQWGRVLKRDSLAFLRDEVQV